MELSASDRLLSFRGLTRKFRRDKKNAGLKSATLISVSNPVSQVLW
jgi:hypothetical protein